MAYESARAELVEQASEQLRALRHTLVCVEAYVNIDDNIVIGEHY